MDLKLVPVFLFFSATANADSLRCGNSWVNTGVRMAEVALKCGEPTFSTVRTETETTKVKDGVDESSVTKEITVVRTIEEWTYDRGPSEFIRFATFENGVLIKVKTGPYGTKKEGGSR